MARSVSEQVIPGRGAISVNDPGTPVPKGWVRTPLMDVGRLESGHTPSRKHPEWWGGDVPWIGIADARENHGGVIHETFQTTNDDGLANSAARLLPAGTVCLSRTASVGYCTIMGRPMATSQDFVNWVCSEAIEPHFLMRAFLAEGEHLLKFGKGSTHTTIYFPEVQAFHIALPPLNEQKRIVAKIDALTEKSREARQALDEVPALLDQLRQSILAAAFRGDLTKKWREQNPDVEPASVLLDRIRTERRRKWEEGELAKFQAKGKLPSDDKWKEKYKEPEPVDTEGLPELPEGWCWARMSELADERPNAIGAGPFGTIFKAKDFRDSGVPIIFLRHIAPGEYRRHKPGFMDADVWDQLYREEYSVYGGELLVTKLGDPPGTAAIYPEGIGAAMVTPDVIKMCVNQGLCLTGYLMHYMNSEVARLFTFGAAYGVTRLRMNLTIFRDMPVPVAPMLEQERLLAQLATADEFIRSSMSRATNSSLELTSLDSSILAKAFRGQLVPQDPNDEPASVLLERIRKEREAGATKKKARQVRTR